MQKSHDAEPNSIPSMQTNVSIDNVACIKYILANKGGSQDMLKTFQPCDEEKVVADD